MVPWQTLILLTAGFFIREVIMRSKQKSNNFDSGYRTAIKDIVRQWNKLSNAERYTAKEFLSCMKEFIERKQDDIA
jgi:hypothetical protein